MDWSFPSKQASDSFWRLIAFLHAFVPFPLFRLSFVRLSLSRLKEGFSATTYATTALYTFPFSVRLGIYRIQPLGK